jgi:capsular polysaccharide transport system permease protein
MMFTSGVVALWGIIFPHVPVNVPLVGIAITGYSCVLLWRNTVSHATRAIQPNLSLFYHRPVRAMDCLLARVLLEVIGATGSFAVLTLFFCTVEVIPWPVDLLPVLGGWLLMCWFALALGMILCAATERSEFIGRIWHIASYLLLPLSGAAFMVYYLPPDYREMALWIPMVHGTELIRYGFFGDTVPTYSNPAYFASADFLLTALGLAMMRDISARVHG